MQNREFYDLENGIHSMKIPRTGRYQLILAGYGYGDSKGAKIQMDMSFIKARGLQNIVRSFLKNSLIPDFRRELVVI